jgi:response regulator NasT
MRSTNPKAPRQVRPPWRVGVLDSDARSRAEVACLIESHGHAVVVDSPPRPDAVALLCDMRPDAVVLAAEDVVPRGDGMGGLFPPDLPAPVVLVATPATVAALEPRRIAAVMGVLLRPLRAEELGQTLEVAIARFRELRRLRRVLADRPVIEQAKAASMSRDGLSEPAAFSWLRRRAMDQRMQMGEVARAVLARDA